MSSTVSAGIRTSNLPSLVKPKDDDLPTEVRVVPQPMSSRARPGLTLNA